MDADPTTLHRLAAALAEADAAARALMTELVRERDGAKAPAARLEAYYTGSDRASANAIMQRLATQANEAEAERDALRTLAATLLDALDAHEDAAETECEYAYRPAHEEAVYAAKAALRALLGKENPDVR